LVAPIRRTPPLLRLVLIFSFFMNCRWVSVCVYRKSLKEPVFFPWVIYKEMSVTVQLIKMVRTIVPVWVSVAHGSWNNFIYLFLTIDTVCHLNKAIKFYLYIFRQLG
jgi:hypothetical protein